jgi:hypothetical protein
MARVVREGVRRGVLFPEVATMSAENSDYRPRCRHLCCKSMMVYGEAFASDPDYQAGMTEFWCVRTSKGAGPDGGGVSLEECSDPQRECFKEF